MTGTWNGYYSFDNKNDQELVGFDKTYFTMIIDVYDGANFTGFVNDDRASGGMEGTGRIIGNINGNKISFKKLMPTLTLLDTGGLKTITDKNHPTLYYSGTFVNNRSEVAGTWKFKLTMVYLLGLLRIPYRGGQGTWRMILQSKT